MLPTIGLAGGPGGSGPKGPLRFIHTLTIQRASNPSIQLESSLYDILKSHKSQNPKVGIE
jgi:hypothetical protein